MKRGGPSASGGAIGGQVRSQEERKRSKKSVHAKTLQVTDVLPPKSHKGPENGALVPGNGSEMAKRQARGDLESLLFV